MGYQVDVVQINWEKKKELVESGEIDCIMGCFSMEGRLDDYRWAGPYIASRQVVAVNESSDIYNCLLYTSTVKSGRGFPEIFPGTGSGISAL